MQNLSKEKIAIIISTKDELYLEECLGYINELEIPEGYLVDLLTLTASANMAASYNEAMQASDAKYKLYIPDTTLILQKDCLVQCIHIFEENSHIGMLGVLGSNNNSDQNMGKAIISDSERTKLLDFQKEYSGYYCTANLDEAFVFTQYDIPWDETTKTLKDCISIQCKCFSQQNYTAAIPYQDVAWCQIDKSLSFATTDSGTQIDNMILKHILEIDRREKLAGNNTFVQPGDDMEGLVQKYNYVKFLLRRIQFQKPMELVQSFYNDYMDGFISKECINVIAEHDLIYSKRVIRTIDGICSGRINLINDDFTQQLIDMQSTNFSEAHCRKMNILTSLNHAYVGPVSVMLESLYHNNPHIPIHVYILHSELTLEDQSLLKNQGCKWDAEVDFIYVDRTLFTKLPTTAMWTLEAFYRLAMTELLPADIDRILYLDVDTLILKPLYDFYFTDFEGTDLIACKDMGTLIPFCDIRDDIFRDHIEKGDFIYCCSGVTLWNLEKLRHKITLNTYMQLAKELDYNIVAPDQDLINLVHYGHIKFMDELQYGCFVKGWDWSVDEVKRCVTILHYAGPKPWNGMHMKDDTFKVWWEYAKETPLYTQMIEKTLFEFYDKEDWFNQQISRLEQMILTNQQV